MKLVNGTSARVKRGFFGLYLKIGSYSIGLGKVRRIIRAYREYSVCGPTTTISRGNVGLWEGKEYGKHGLAFRPKSLCIGCQEYSVEDIKTIAFFIL